eukprot:GHVS01084873.1.p1 GENE.GHVS01084873.1~~GHVS01084873.1.p1  ORF type:complete len:496 (+),score=80.12 GHVS01084873.1:88-1575(+)
MVTLLPDVWSADMSSDQIRPCDCSGWKDWEQRPNVVSQTDSVRRRKEDGKAERDVGEGDGKMDKRLRRRRKQKRKSRTGTEKNVTFNDPLLVTCHEYPAAVYEEEEEFMCYSELSSTTPRCGKTTSDEGTALRTGHLKDDSDEDGDGIHADPNVAVLPIPSRRNVPLTVDEWNVERTEECLGDCPECLEISDGSQSDGSELGTSDEPSDTDDVVDEHRQWIPSVVQPPSTCEVGADSCAQSTVPHLDLSASSLAIQSDPLSCAETLEGNAPRHRRKNVMTFADVLDDENPPVAPNDSLLLPVGSGTPHPQEISFSLPPTQPFPPSPVNWISPHLSQLPSPLWVNDPDSPPVYDEGRSIQVAASLSNELVDIQKEEAPFLSLHLSAPSLILGGDHPCCFLLNGQLCEGDTSTSKASVTTLSSSPSNTPMPVPKNLPYEGKRQDSSFDASTPSHAISPVSNLPRTAFSEQSDRSDLIIGQQPTLQCGQVWNSGLCLR